MKSIFRNFGDGSFRALTIIAIVVVAGLGTFTVNPEQEAAVVTIADPVVVQAGGLEVDGPQRVDAGEGFVIQVVGAEPGRLLLTAIDTGYGIRSIETVAGDEMTEVTVEPFEVPASGATVITVTQDELAGRLITEIEPGPPVDPIDVYLGPRTVIADAEHFVMIVAVPEDIFGNPVAAGTPVDFTTTRPNQVIESEQFETADLLAWYEVFSRTVTGRTRIATEAGSAGASEQTFLEVAGEPVPYGLELIDPLLPADGIALLTIGTEPLADEYGNLLPDGTVATLDVSGVTGSRRIFGQTIDGRSLFTLEVPSIPGDVTMVASASGVTSEPLTLSFPTAVRSVIAELELLEEVAVVHVGPIRSVRGSFIPEGTVARVTAADGSTAVADLSLGIGDAFLPLDADLSSITVEVLGTETVLRQNR